MNVVGAVCVCKGGLSQSALGKSGSVGGWCRRVRERNERGPLTRGLSRGISFVPLFGRISTYESRDGSQPISKAPA
jgi:hypothetical protein